MTSPMAYLLRYVRTLARSEDENALSPAESGTGMLLLLTLFLELLALKAAPL